MPTVVWQPGHVLAGTVCDSLATTTDLLPNFAKLAGGNAPQDRQIDGRDITSLIHGDANTESPYEVFYYYNRDQLHAVRSGPWKLFLPFDPAVGHPHLKCGDAPQPLLFHLYDDIGGEKDVAQNVRRWSAV